MEIGSFIKIALGLLCAALLVGLTFKAIKPATSSAGKNLTSMQASMDQMDTTEFDAYDQTSINGTQVLAAVKLFSQRDIGVLVQTKKSGANAYNYGTLLGSASDSSPQVSAPSDTDWKDNTNLVMEFASTDLVKNVKSAEATKTGGANFILPSGNFDCKVIKDGNNAIVGIYCKQRPN